ncbi:MAG: hypothetical protein ABJE10_19145 [bacterium]
MSDGRPWYKEPETFIALTALVVSVSAVVVGIYEASLQRAHDRAEVWPHLELATLTTSNGASLSVTNSGIGPAIIKSVVVTVDGTPRRNWADALQALEGKPVTNFTVATIVDRGVRAGDKVEMIMLSPDKMPADFWSSIARVGITVCYASVFDEYWQLSDPRLGKPGAWRSVTRCPPQSAGTEF